MESLPVFQDRMYLCIDGKSFYASVECAERGLNPFETNLVVADPSRGKNALCLAISPKMKALGVHNRCRLSDIPGNIKYEIALPRMDLPNGKGLYQSGEIHGSSVFDWKD